MLVLGGKMICSVLEGLCFKVLKDILVEKDKVFRTLARGLSDTWVNEFRSLEDRAGLERYV